jgi:opine dehydrogenase
MDVAVLGGGHGSYAAAADLADRGFAVRLWRRDGARLAALGDEPTLELVDAAGTRRVALALATADLGEALRGVELVVVPLPASAQVALADRLAGHLVDGQVLYIPPGSFGSYAMARVLAQRGCTARVAFAESGTLPYLARKRDERTVVVTGRTTRLPTGAFPAERSAEVLATVRAAYPELEERRDALDAALLNAGPIIHPPLILLNAGPIEATERYDIHNEGTQPSVRRVQGALDAERVRLREALGYGPPHFPLRDHYEAGGEEWMYGDLAHQRLVTSENWREPLDLHRHRYMVEDVACGLALLVSLAEWAGVPCPVGTGLLAVASAVVGRDLRREGRTVESLGLAGEDRDGLADRLARGPIAVAA